ncbi:DUF853 family protein [Klebsiella pneumoniae subsp. pneumoniae]|nr:helicase HerA-like domain-containing protein [Klebsiella pneumoniae]MCS6689010.1 DUF853 family protein [Klebsiella pneumoniae subsp. pneumoniae]
MSSPLLIARTLDNALYLLPAMANRHGLITGATGTGKTVTLQKLAESFSEIGVPVFMAGAVLGQLGNRVQHALRAFTPKDQKAVKTAAQTMRANPAFSTEQAIQELGTGEALISFLDEKGSPSVVERAMVIAPCSRMGPVSDDERNGLLNHSPLYGKYEEEVDRESAFEMLQQGVQVATGQQSAPPAKGQQNGDDDGLLGGLKDILFGSTGPRGGKRDGIVQTAAKSAVRQVTNQIVRGMLGSLLGGRKR